MRKNSRLYLLSFFVLFVGFGASGNAQVDAESERVGIEEEEIGLSIESLTPYDNPAQRGSYPIVSHTKDLGAVGYKSAILYSPIGPGPYPATTLTAGFTNTKEDIAWLGQHLASHGIITIVFTPTNPYVGDPRMWATGHEAAIETLKRENRKPGSPLAGKVDEEHLAITGYSMGGAGSVLAANELGDAIKAVIPISAYLPSVPTSQAAYLFVAGNRDTVSLASRVGQAFNAMRTDAPKAYANINGMDHYGVLTRGNKHEEISRMATAWLKNFLAGDNRYLSYFDGAELDKLLEEGKVFARPSDFLFVP